jgi:uncharacterized membrane protein
MNSRSNRKNVIPYLITIFVSVILLFAANRYVSSGESIFHGDSQDNIARAVVRTITEKTHSSREYDETTTVESTDILFSAGIQSGRFSGRNITAIQTLDGFSYVEIKEVEPGDRVMLILNEISPNEFEWRFVDYVRSDKLVYLAVFFFIALILFGRAKGFNTILSLSFTCLAVFTVFVPSILSGRNIYLWSLLTCVYVILTTLLIVSGFNRKTLAAAAG